MQGRRPDDKSDNGDSPARAVHNGAGWVRISGAGRSHARARCARARCVRNNAANANNCSCRARYAPAIQFGEEGLPAHYRIRCARYATTARRATCLLRRYHAATAAKPVARGRSHPLS